MHYKNGREAKNGDKVVMIGEFGEPPPEPFFGVLYNARAGNDYCNGRLAALSPQDVCPNLKECLHLDDFIAALPVEFPDTSKK